MIHLKVESERAVGHVKRDTCCRPVVERHKRAPSKLIPLQTPFQRRAGLWHRIESFVGLVEGQIANDRISSTAGRQQPVRHATFPRIRAVTRHAQLTKLATGRLVRRADEEDPARVASLPVIHPCITTVEACEFQMMLLPEPLAGPETAVAVTGAPAR